MSSRILEGLKYHDAYSFTRIKVPVLSRVVSFTLWPIYPDTHQTEFWMGLKAGLEMVVKRKSVHAYHPASESL
jgi:hypothetical protein